MEVVWRYRELLVAMVDVLLTVVKTAPAHHLAAHGRESPVAAKDEVGVDFLLFAPPLRGPSRNVNVLASRSARERRC